MENTDVVGKVFSIEDFRKVENYISLDLFDETSFYKDLLDELGWSAEDFLYVSMDDFVGIFSLIGSSESRIKLENYFIWDYRVPRNCQRHFFNRYKNSVKLITFDNSHNLFNANAKLPRDSFFDDVKNIVKLVNAGKKKVGDIMKEMSSQNQRPICLNSFEKAVVVNVGFGNCCFLYNKSDVLAIDCSNKEKGRFSKLYTGGYSSNIADAIDCIKTYQRKKTFHISAFLLTHPHYDHFSGIPELASRQYLTNTPFFMNTKCILSGSAFAVLMATLKQSNVALIDAIIGNGMQSLSILHPQSSQPTYSNLNNLSVVSKVDVSNGSFIFPGDLEQTGWSQFCTNNSVAVNAVKNAEYYMVSHHGSLTGDYPSCFPQNPKGVYCSTRSNVHSGVPANSVLNKVSNVNNVKCCTEQNPACRFIEIDFATSQSTIH